MPPGAFFDFSYYHCSKLKQQNLTHVNFGMTNAPNVVFSLPMKGFVSVTCC